MSVVIITIRITIVVITQKMITNESNNNNTLMIKMIIFIIDVITCIIISYCLSHCIYWHHIFSLREIIKT